MHREDLAIDSKSNLGVPVEAPAPLAGARIIRASQKHPIFELLEGSAAIGTFHADLNRNTVEWSDEVFRRYGIDPSDNVTLGDAWHRIHPDDRSALAKAISDGFASGTGYEAEFRVINSAGETVWNSIRARIHGSTVLGVVFDITHSRQTAEKKRADRLRLKLAQRVGKVALWERDFAIDRISWSGDVEALYGVDADQLDTFPKWTARIHPDDRGAIFASHERVIRGEAEHYAEFRALLPDGSTRWLMTRGQLLRTPDGAPLAIIGANTDITEQKLADLALRDSEERFRGVFHNSIVPIVLAAPDGSFISSNAAFSRLVGYTEQELTGIGFQRLTHPDDRDRNIQLHHDLIAGRNNGFTIEKRYIRKDGDVVWVRVNMSVLRDTHGAPLQVIAIAEDITAQKNATAETAKLMSELESERGNLHSAIEQLRLIEETLKAGTWVFDIATGVSHWPPGISALWGLPPEPHQVRLDEFIQRTYPEDRERVAAVIQKALASGGTYHVEFRVVWPDNSIHWLAARGAVVAGPDGKPQRVIGIALENTQQVRTEEALRESEKLAAAGRLAATIAHEINNPLESVTNLLYIALNNPNLPTGVREYLELADQELARVSHIARQTLGFYRDSAVPENVDLSETVNQVLEVYGRKIAPKEISMRKELFPGVFVRGSKGELRQVVSNIILNAVDAVHRGGTIVVRVRRSGDHTVQFSVADNGPGISRASREKIFQPFFTTKRDVGTGLGLWVSKGIVDKHGGRIFVRSCTEEGRSGAAFVVKFPAAETAAAAPR